MKIKRGSVTLSIIPHRVTVKGTEYEYHRVRYYQDGRPYRPTFKTADAAAQFAETKATELSNGRTAANDLTAADAASIARIKQILADRGIQTPPELAIAEYCDQLTAAAARQKATDKRIAYPELVSVFMGSALNNTGQAIEIIAITLGVYLVLGLAVSAFMNWYNARMALVVR